jgi:hypothetical protein
LTPSEGVGFQPSGGVDRRRPRGRQLTIPIIAPGSDTVGACPDSLPV